MYKIAIDKLAPRIDLLSGAQLIGNLGNYGERYQYLS